MFSQTSDSEYLRCEMDSHADTCLAGNNFIAFENTGQTVSIYGFDDNAPPVTGVPIATFMTAVTLESGETLILVVHQALFLGEKHNGSLLCPNQMQKHGVRVDDCPRHLSLGMNSTHSIIVKEEDVTIPLQLEGTISYFNSHLPTRHKFETCCHIELTSQEQWDPKAEDIAQEEQKYIEHQEGNPEERQINAVSRISVVDTVLEDIDSMLSGICMLETMCRISAVSTDDKRGPISSQRLSKIWGIGLDTAKNTLRVITRIFCSSLIFRISLIPSIPLVPGRSRSIAIKSKWFC